VDGWHEGDPAPDVWALLSSVVRKAGRGGAGDQRLVIDDSKKAKLANLSESDSKRVSSRAARHPLMHLERGVLSFLACRELTWEDGATAVLGPPASDAALLEALGATLPNEPWYAGEDIALPLTWTPEQAAIAANQLRRALDGDGTSDVGVVDMRTLVLSESDFNRLVENGGGKGATTEAALFHHVRHAWQRWSHIDSQHGGPRIVCDAHGGRTQYADMLARALGDDSRGMEVVIVEESASRSRYLLQGTDSGGVRRALTISFMPEADGSHLPVALASMTAKLARELLMMRFNRHWKAVMPELKPTAGYTQDARRWLDDAREVITARDRTMMVRRA
jgi:hypothetical protein